MNLIVTFINKETRQTTIYQGEGLEKFFTESGLAYLRSHVWKNAKCIMPDGHIQQRWRAYVVLAQIADSRSVEQVVRYAQESHLADRIIIRDKNKQALYGGPIEKLPERFLHKTYTRLNRRNKIYDLIC